MIDQLERFKKWSKKAPMGRCMHWGYECKKPVGSHLVSKCVLRLIASEQHLIVFEIPTIGDSLKAKKAKDITMLGMHGSSKGINNVSTFPGFCASHDSELFAEIDSTDLRPASSVCSKLAYRCFSQSVAIKYQTAGALLERGSVESAGPAASIAAAMFEPFIEINTLQEETRWSTFEGGDENLHHYWITLADKLPFAGAGAFRPYVKASGAPMKENKQWMSISVLPQKKGTAVSLSFRNTERNNPETLLKSMERIPGHLFGDWLLRFCLETIETLYLSPEWWNSLSLGKQKFFGGLARPSIYDHFADDHRDLRKIFACKGATDFRTEILSFSKVD